ncbi:hypothetical protein VE03_05099 [Pseudogymnoascus sp. 23342-1-I1]|nr:hypothetical protein VE03_05099 [Pseudogymnoascus sp. 23342-1-I1]
MGEHFLVTAPLSRRRLNWRDGLRELFFSENKARTLVYHLIVPAEPQKQLQKESQKQAAAPSAATPANFQSTAAVAPPKLADSESAISTPRATFNTLPAEIYSLIFNHLNDNVDLTCMGLATPYLWGITQSIMYHRYKARLGKWAGEKIVIVGEDIGRGDYPPDLFSAEEAEALLKEVQVWDRKRYPRRTVPITSIDLTYLPATYETGLTIAAEAARVYYAVLRRYSRHPSIKQREDLLWIFTERPDFTPRDEAWVLRNLTTKEFVTAEGIAFDKERIEGPFVYGIGFADAILARALWTSRGTGVLEYGGQIGRGVWAGHRFEITTRSRHDQATKGEEWKDVSEEVRGEIVGIWESQFGAEWRDRGRLDERFCYSDDGLDGEEDEPDVVHDLQVYVDYAVNVHPYYNRY